MTLTADKFRSKNAQDAEAWLEATFDEHWSRVYGVLYRLVGDHAEAEDLALEAFWRLHSRRAAVDSEHGLGGWLYRVAVNLGFNALRSQKRRRHYESQAGQLVMDDRRDPDPAAQVEKEQDRQRVRDTLAQMRPRSARLLVLRHSGLSYAELSTALNLAPGSIGTLLARAEQEFEEKYRSTEGD